MINRLKFLLNEHKYFLTVIVLYLIIQYIYYFSQGNIILGGEGNYWLDFNVLLQKGGLYTWLNFGNGLQATSLNTFFSYPIIFSFIGNYVIRSYLIIAVIFLMPFITMYLLLRRLDHTKMAHIILISLFFITNPFSIHFLYALNPWGVHILFIYPLYFFILHRFYNNNFLLFYTFGLISLIFAYSFANPPHMVLIIVMLPVILSVIQIMYFNKFKFFELIKKTSIVYISLLLFHLWWIIHWVIILPDARKLYTHTFARSWLESVSSDVSLIMKDIFSLTWIVSKDPNYHFLSYYYNNQFMKIAVFIPFFVLIYWFTFKRSAQNRVVKILLVLLFLMTLLMKAANPPFPGIMFFCFDHIPLCYLFKTAPEKFGVIFIFLISLLLFYVLNDLRVRWIKWLMYFYIFLTIIPFAIGRYIPDQKTDFNDYVSRKYTDLEEFKQFRSYMNAQKRDFRVLSFPNGGNYQVKLNLYDNIYYTGLDPVLSNISHPHLADHMEIFKTWPLYQTLDKQVNERLMYLYSIRYLHVNSRLRSWFGNVANKNIDELKKVFNAKYRHVQRFGLMDVYETPNFLPYVYTAKQIVNVTGTADKLTDTLTKMDSAVRPAIYFSEDNINKPPKNAIINKTPFVEYKHINGAELRVTLHGVRESIPLIYNESYHRLWKAYLIHSPFLSEEEFLNQINNYYVSEENKADQAAREELKSFYSSGILSSVGNKFVSKEFEGSIQNENINNGWMFESALLTAVPENSHLKVNGFANSWIIDPAVLCTENRCRKNADGTYDITLLIEFFPQKVFYFTFAITIMTVISSSFLLVFRYNFRKKSRKNP